MRTRKARSDDIGNSTSPKTRHDATPRPVHIHTQRIVECWALCLMHTIQTNTHLVHRVTGSVLEGRVGLFYFDRLDLVVFAPHKMNIKLLVCVPLR